MGHAFSIVPTVGSALWLTCAILAQRSDLGRQRSEALKGRRVLPRPWSIVSDDPQHAGHWFVLAASVVYASVVPACALWRGAAMGRSDLPLVTVAGLSATGFFLMAIVPHADGGLASSVWHNITAGVFLGAGSAWALRSVFVLQEIQGMGIALIVRAIATSAMFLSVLAMLFGALPLYIVAARKFNAACNPREGNTSRPEPLLAEEEEWGLRKQIAVLFVTQATWGASLAVVMATCAAEVVAIEHANDYTIGGIVAGAALLSTAGCALCAARLTGGVPSLPKFS